VERMMEKLNRKRGQKMTRKKKLKIANDEEKQQEKVLKERIEEFLCHCGEVI
jgi:hypothetical protein